MAKKIDLWLNDNGTIAILDADRSMIAGWCQEKNRELRVSLCDENGWANWYMGRAFHQPSEHQDESNSLR